MRSLLMALGFFRHARWRHWPGLGWYFAGWGLYRGTGVRLFDEWVLRFKSFKVGADVTGRSGLVFLHEILVRDIYGCRAWARDPQVRTVFDAGANCGFFALTLSGLDPRVQVHCFEPQPATFRHLVQNLALNALTDRVRAVAAAVGEQSGQCELNVSPESSMGIVATSPVQFLERSTRVAVPLVSLDDYATSEGVWPDLLKIDVEGFEVEALRGARACLRRARQVILEFHSDALRDHCLTLLRDAGFHPRVAQDLIFAQRPVTS